MIDVYLEAEPEVVERSLLEQMYGQDVVNLQREGYHDMGTFGRLKYRDFECFTVERAWVNNQQFVSCIPPGCYPIVLGKYFKGGYPTYELLEVPGRYKIKIHVANTAPDLMGCIGLGTKQGVVNNLWAVTNSKLAHQKFMEAMGGVKKTWIIVEDPPRARVKEVSKNGGSLNADNG